MPIAGNENPGALAGATGVKCHEKVVVQQEYIVNTSRAIVQLIEAAESGDADACTMALRGLRRLPLTHRATLAALTLGSLDDDTAEHVMTVTLRHAGMPQPDAFNPMAGARHWACWASLAERKCYAVATFEALDDTDRAAFLRRYAGGVEA